MTTEVYCSIVSVVMILLSGMFNFTDTIPGIVFMGFAAAMASAAIIGDSLNDE